MFREVLKMDFIRSFFLGKGTVFFISQVLSLIAAVLLLASFQQRTHKRIVVMQACSGLLFGTQYLLIGAYEGMICNFIGMLRSVIYSFRGKSKYVDSIICPSVFALSFLISGVITYQNAFSHLPMIAMAIASFVMWNPKTQQLRALTLPTSFMWLIYNIACDSYVAILTEICCEISIIIGLIRFREKKNTGTKEKEKT